MSRIRLQFVKIKSDAGQGVICLPPEPWMLHIRDRPMCRLCQRIIMTSHAQSYAIYKAHRKRKWRTFGAHEEPRCDSYTILPGNRRFIHVPEKRRKSLIAPSYWIEQRCLQRNEQSATKEMNTDLDTVRSNLKVTHGKCIPASTQSARIKEV